MELSERNKLIIARVENFNYILRTAMLVLLGTLALCIFASGNAHIWPLSITIIGATLYGILAGNTAINDMDALRKDMDDETKNTKLWSFCDVCTTCCFQSYINCGLFSNSCFTISYVARINLI